MNAIDYLFKIANEVTNEEEQVQLSDTINTIMDTVILNDITITKCNRMYEKLDKNNVNLEEILISMYDYIKNILNCSSALDDIATPLLEQSSMSLNIYGDFNTLAEINNFLSANEANDQFKKIFTFPEIKNYNSYFTLHNSILIKIYNKLAFSIFAYWLYKKKIYKPTKLVSILNTYDFSKYISKILLKILTDSSCKIRKDSFKEIYSKLNLFISKSSYCVDIQIPLSIMVNNFNIIYNDISAALLFSRYFDHNYILARINDPMYKNFLALLSTRYIFRIKETMSTYSNYTDLKHCLTVFLNNEIHNRSITMITSDYVNMAIKSLEDIQDIIVMYFTLYQNAYDTVCNEISGNIPIYLSIYDLHWYLVNKVLMRVPVDVAYKEKILLDKICAIALITDADQVSFINNVINKFLQIHKKIQYIKELFTLIPNLHSLQKADIYIDKDIFIAIVNTLNPFIYRYSMTKVTAMNAIENIELNYKTIHNFLDYIIDHIKPYMPTGIALTSFTLQGGKTIYVDELFRGYE